MLLIVTLSMQIINNIELVMMWTRTLQVQAMVFLFHVQNLERRGGQAVHTCTRVCPAIAIVLNQPSLWVHNQAVHTQKARA
jgi:hypothetical protein